MTEHGHKSRRMGQDAGGDRSRVRPASVSDLSRDVSQALLGGIPAPARPEIG